MWVCVYLSVTSMLICMYDCTCLYVAGICQCVCRHLPVSICLGSWMSVNKVCLICPWLFMFFFTSWLPTTLLLSWPQSSELTRPSQGLPEKNGFWRPVNWMDVHTEKEIRHPVICTCNPSTGEGCGNRQILGFSWPARVAYLVSTSTVKKVGSTWETRKNTSHCPVASPRCAYPCTPIHPPTHTYLKEINRC